MTLVASPPPAASPCDDPVIPGHGRMHLLCATPPGNFRRLIHRYGPVDPHARGRASAIRLFGALGLPARLSYRFFLPAIDRATLDPPPLFILGHWRSGTTWLHELLAVDPNMAYPTMWHCLTPHGVLTCRWLRPLFAWAMPKTRPMDDIPLDMTAPMEEECAMAVVGDVSFYHAFYFPQHARTHFRRAVMLEGLTAEELARWQQRYRRFVQAVALARPGRRLVLKNPANTARIPAILDLFPEARFLHIHRHPFDVYASMLRTRQRMVERVGLQTASKRDLAEQVLDQYEAVMQRYLATREAIPADRLIEVRYEDLERDPLAQLRAIYEKLDLGDFAAARPHIETHLHARSDYQKNDHRLDHATRDRIRERWRFAFDQWGYARA
jgi:LPS sulfotransferase NodH